MKLKQGDTLSQPVYNVSEAKSLAFKVTIMPSIREIEGDIIVKADTSSDSLSWAESYAMMIITVDTVPLDEPIKPTEEIISITPVFYKINYLKLYIENQTNTEIDIEIKPEFKGKRE